MNAPRLGRTVTNLNGRTVPFSPITGLPTSLPSEPIIKSIPAIAPPQLAVKISPYERKLLEAEGYRDEELLPDFDIISNVISILSNEDVERMAVVEVKNAIPGAPNSLDDPRMGPTDNKSLCATCKKDITRCPGHLGMIKFNQPIYHPQYLRHITWVLTSICNSCGSLLCPVSFLESEEIPREAGGIRLARIADLSKDKTCESHTPKQMPNGPCAPIQEQGPILRCVPNPTFVSSKTKDTKQIMYKMSKDDPAKPMPISEVRKILCMISQEDAETLGFGEGVHPRDLVRDNIPVIPFISRYPNYENGEMKPHELTRVYEEIIKKNDALADPMKVQKALQKAEEYEKKRKEKGITAKRAIKVDLHSQLFGLVEILLGVSTNKKGGRKFGDTRGFKDLIQGKRAAFRGLLMGKRTNYSGRTVLSPDPSLEFGQIRIPNLMAPYLTKPITVTAFAIDRIYQLLEDGKISHIIRGTGELKGIPIRVIAGKKYKLEINQGKDVWIVHRHLQNGDYVVFNRQPTLHKYGIMAFRTVLSDAWTFGLHPAITGPYNADFDGDEAPVYDIQTYDAESEARYIMNVTECLLSSQQNRPILGTIMDTISGAYIMTDPEIIMDEDLFYGAIAQLKNPSGDLITNLFDRCDKYKTPRLSGRALFSALLPPDFKYQMGKVTIIEGILISGRITRAHIGAAGGSIVHAIIRDPKYSSPDFRLQKVLLFWYSDLPIAYSDPLVQFPDELFFNLISQINVLTAEEIEDLFRRLDSHNIPRYSGRAVISAAIPPNFNYNGVDIQVVDGIFTHGYLNELNQDDFVNTLIKYLARDPKYDSNAEQFPRILQFLTDAPWLVNWWITEWGLTVGFSDCLPVNPKRLEDVRNKELSKARILAESVQNRLTDPLEEEARERQILMRLGNVRDLGIKVAIEEMSPENQIRAMTDLGGGAKGTAFHVAQISTLLGQQVFRGHRMKPGLVRFPKGDISIESRGYITSSFLSGLKPWELFFHLLASREGLLDTATKTPESGATHHKLAKSFEMMEIARNGAVQDVNGTIYSFLYGGDGFDGAGLIRYDSVKGAKINGFIDLKQVAISLNMSSGWLPKNIYKELEQRQSNE